jgi:hypothetical protein
MNLIGLVCNNFKNSHTIGEIVEKSLLGDYYRVRFYDTDRMPNERKYKFDWLTPLQIAEYNWYEPMTKEKFFKRLGL